MKRRLLFSLLLVFGLSLSAQVVYNPNIAIRPSLAMSIYKVEMTPESTVVTVRMRNQTQLPPFSIISKNLILRRSGEPDALKLVKSEKVPFAPQKHTFSFKDEILEFTLYFPPLPQPAKYIDIQEEGNDKQFYLQGIILDADMNREITRGFRSFERGDQIQALEAFTNAAEMDPYFEFGIAHLNVIYLYTLQNKWTEAREWYKKFNERFFYDKQVLTNSLAQLGLIQKLEADR